MKVNVNEIVTAILPGTTLGEVADRFKPGADVLILNGFPSKPDDTLSEGDSIALIRRGEVPGRAELEEVMIARHTPGVHEVVKRSTVGIAGAGGLGSNVAVALARLGIGKLIIADFDVVEPSNLNRQCFFVDQLGELKVDALKATLLRVNPFVEVETKALRLTTENIPTIFAGCRVLVEAFDGAEQKAMLVETALAKLRNTFVVAASGLAGFGPGEDIRPHRVGERLIIIGDLSSEARRGSGLMAPRVGIAANMQANTVLRVLLGEETAG